MACPPVFMRRRSRIQRIMKSSRVHRTLGALALLGFWVFVPVGSVLGGSTGLVLFLTALGLLAGASAGLLGHQRVPLRGALPRRNHWPVGAGAPRSDCRVFRVAAVGGAAVARSREGPH